MKIIQLIFLVMVAGKVMASEAEDFIKEGIRFHDAGEYDKAVHKYKEALELEPGNALALYEMGFTYMVSNQNELCIETAKKGLAIESELQNKFNTTLGSCYSQQGKIDEALAVFQVGLKNNPADAQLHLNVAVTLANKRQDKGALKHLKEAVKLSGGYSTPYYYMAEIYRSNNYRIPAMFLYMQFVLLEPNTERSQDASKKIYYLLYQGVKKKEKGDMDIVINSELPKDEGDYEALELALSFAAASSVMEEEGKSKMDVERHTEALNSFIKICSEIDDKELKKTFAWEYAAKNMIALQKSDDFKTYAYILAARAGAPGASSWLEQNRNKIEKMSKAISLL